MASASANMTSAVTPSASSSLSRSVDVPGAAEALLVVGLPPHDVVVIHLQQLVAVGLALGQVLVELRVVPLLEIGPVALGLAGRQWASAEMIR